MMTQFKVHRSAVLRLGAAIPVVAGMLMLCSFTVKHADMPEPSGRPVVTVHIDADGKITFNDRSVTVGELEALVAAEREKLAEVERAHMEVVLKADKGSRMNEVTDVKAALRRADALKVRYSLTCSDSEVLRMLPPDSSRMPANVKLIAPNDKHGSIVLKLRNYFQVYVNADGKMLSGPAGRMEYADLRSLKASVREFLLNPQDNSRLSEKSVREFDLPGGGTMSYPVSEGIVAIQVASKTPYGRYLEVQQAIGEVFGEIRDNLSRRQFGRDYASLTEPERQIIVRAVPLKIMEAEPRSLP